jgi:hypothetical protein
MTMRLIHRWIRECSNSKAMPDPKAEAGKVSEKPECRCHFDWTDDGIMGGWTQVRILNPSCPRHGKVVEHV